MITESLQTVTFELQETELHISLTCLCERLQVDFLLSTELGI